MSPGKGGGVDDSALRFTNLALMSIFFSSPLSSHNPFSYELSNMKKLLFFIYAFILIDEAPEQLIFRFKQAISAKEA
jgi:hypothetical protein